MHTFAFTVCVCVCVCVAAGTKLKIIGFVSFLKCMRVHFANPGEILKLWHVAHFSMYSFVHILGAEIC